MYIVLAHILLESSYARPKHDGYVFLLLLPCFLFPAINYFVLSTWRPIAKLTCTRARKTDSPSSLQFLPTEIFFLSTIQTHRPHSSPPVKKFIFFFSQYSPTRFLIALHTFLNADPIFNLCCTLIFCALLLHVYVIVRKSSRESLAVIGSLSQHINWIDDTNTSFDFGSKYCVHSDRSLPSSFFSNSRNQFSVSRLENLEAWDECDVQRCVRTHCYYFNVPFYTFCLFPCLFKQINDLVSSKSYPQATINEDICNTLEIWHKCFLKLLR